MLRLHGGSIICPAHCALVRSKCHATSCLYLLVLKHAYSMLNSVCRRGPVRCGHAWRKWRPAWAESRSSKPATYQLSNVRN